MQPPIICLGFFIKFQCLGGQSVPSKARKDVKFNMTNRKKDKSFMETKEGKRAIMLKEMWDKLHNVNAKSTGIPALDKEIIEKIGEWRNVQK
jgi:hypothetical protein